MGKSVIISGFHRSGTSLTARLLHRSGMFLGEHLLGADFANVHGHFEDWEIIRLHDEILADNGLTWQVEEQVLPEVREPYLQRLRQISEDRKGKVGHGVWGFKDPRACLLLDTWKSLLPEAKMLIIYRSPVETTSSLHKRAANGILRRMGNQKFHNKFWEVPDLALKMWLVYNRRLIEFANAHPEGVLVFPFDLLRKELPLIRLLNQHWELGLEEVETSEVFDPDITAKRGNKQPVADEGLIGEVLDTWESLEQLTGETAGLLGSATPDGGALTRGDFSDAGDTYDVLIEHESQGFEVDFLEGRVQDLEQNQEELAQKRAELEKAWMRYEESKGAEKDLKLIIGRMSRSRLAPAFRLKEEFKELERKYLE